MYVRHHFDFHPRRFLRKALKRFASRGLVLLYHRVADEAMDPWGLCVHPDRFAEQMEVLRVYYRPMPLRTMVEHLHSASLPSGSVAITFDDGYADNLYTAKPLMQRYEIPATVFIITGSCEQRRQYWWDELESILLRPGDLPSSLSLMLDGKQHTWHLNSAAQYTDEDYRRDLHRRVWEAAPGSRSAFFYEVWKELQPLTARAQQQALEALRRWAKSDRLAEETRRPLSLDELIQLEDGGLISIGAHTVRHPLLPAHPPEVQRNEIVESRRWLERVLAHPVTDFSYPFGAYDQELVPVVRAEGFTSASATIEEAVWRGSDPFQLPRFEVQNWDGDQFHKKLREWLQT